MSLRKQSYSPAFELEVVGEAEESNKALTPEYYQRPPHQEADSLSASDRQWAYVFQGNVGCDSRCSTVEGTAGNVGDLNSLLKQAAAKNRADSPKSVDGAAALPLRKQSYAPAFKLEVVKEAEESNKARAARKFNVDRKQVRDWCRAKQKLLNLPEGAKRSPGGGRKVQHKGIEEDLLEWVHGLQAAGVLVTGRMLKNEAQRRHKLNGNADFTASSGWLLKFKKRHNVTCQRSTRVAQQPKQLTDDGVHRAHTVGCDSRCSTVEGTVGNEGDPHPLPKKSAARDEEGSSNSVDGAAAVPLRKQSYPPAFKLEVVKEAEENSKAHAAKKFKVDRKCVREWCREKQKLLCLPVGCVPDSLSENAAVMTEYDPHSLTTNDAARDGEELLNSKDGSHAIPQKKQSYSPSFKLEVVREAEERSKHHAAKKFGVDRKRVRDWCNDKQKLLSLPETAKRSPGGGRKVQNKDVEDGLLKWVHGLQAAGMPVTGTALKNEALRRHKLNGNSNFMASHGWYIKFKKRNNIACQRSKYGPQPRKKQNDDGVDRDKTAAVNDEYGSRSVLAEAAERDEENMLDNMQGLYDYIGAQAWLEIADKYRRTGEPIKFGGVSDDTAVVVQVELDDGRRAADDSTASGDAGSAC